MYIHVHYVCRWLKNDYSHYSLHKTTPTLGVRAELGTFPTYIPAIQRLTNYMAYLSDPDLHPLAAKAIVQQSIAAKTKFSWWNNAWRILNHFQVSESTISRTASKHLKEDIQGEYRRWWITFLATPTNSPKLDTYRQFHTSFHTAPYLNTGLPYFRPRALCFRYLLQPQTGHRTRPTHPNPQRTTNLQIVQRNPHRR